MDTSNGHIVDIQMTTSPETTSIYLLKYEGRAGFCYLSLNKRSLCLKPLSYVKNGKNDTNIITGCEDPWLEGYLKYSMSYLAVCLNKPMIFYNSDKSH